MKKIIINRQGQGRTTTQLDIQIYHPETNRYYIGFYRLCSLEKNSRDLEGWSKEIKAGYRERKYIEKSNYNSLEDLEIEPKVYKTRTSTSTHDFSMCWNTMTISDYGLGTSNPILTTLSKALSKEISYYFNGETKYERGIIYSSGDSKVFTKETELIYSFLDNDVILSFPYALNGRKMGLKEISNKLSRMMIFKGSIEKRHSFEERRLQMKKQIKSIMKTPEDIMYCLENRVPYHFFNYGNQGRGGLVQVRLNLKQISYDSYALEIGDGVWGEISQSDLLTYLGHYLHGYKRGSWKFLSPKKLYSKIMGKEMSVSEHKVMVAFLLQNRTQDLVEKRAKQLIDEMAVKYKDRILVIKGDDHIEDKYSRKLPTKILVKGEMTDWLLVEKLRSYSSGDPQRVHTHCLLTEKSSDEEGGYYAHWSSAICINTGGKNPSLGDQFATRVLSLMNDRTASVRVNTISDYMVQENDSRLRVPLKEEYTNQGDRYDEKMLRM